jgi:hypothetical protein
MLPSQTSCHFIPLRSKPSCSKIPSICILPLTLETMFHTHTNITGVFQYTNNTYEYLVASKASTEICPQIYTCRYKTSTETRLDASDSKCCTLYLHQLKRERRSSTCRRTVTHVPTQSKQSVVTRTKP